MKRIFLFIVTSPAVLSVPSVDARIAALKAA
jgi:hypothetical protein